MRLKIFIAIALLLCLLSTAALANKAGCEVALQNAIEVKLAFTTRTERVNTAKNSYNAMLRLWNEAILSTPRVSDDILKNREAGRYLFGVFSKKEFIALLIQQLDKLHRQFDIHFANFPEEREYYQRTIAEMAGVGVATENLGAIFFVPESALFYDNYVSPMQRYYSAMLVAYGWARAKQGTQKTKFKILDLGAGTGDTTYAIQKLLPNTELTALDISNSMLSILKAHFPAVKTIQADFTQNIPLENDSVDMVISVCSASLYPDLNQFKNVLNKVKRILKPGGYFLFDFGHPYSRSQNELGSLSALLELLKYKGFFTEEEIKLLLKIRGGELSPILVQKPER